MNSLNKFLGQEGFSFFFGKVVDRNDPLSLGRVRLRIFGIHPDDITLVPDNSLPWAMPIQPINSAGAYGIGSAPVGPVPGSHVLGFWLDPGEFQQPCFIGTIAGGTGQFTPGQTVGNAATDIANGVGSLVGSAINYILPASNTANIAKAVSFANILRTKFG